MSYLWRQFGVKIVCYYVMLISSWHKNNSYLRSKSFIVNNVPVKTRWLPIFFNKSMYQYWSTNCRFVCILHLLHNSMPSHTSYTEIYMSDTCFCTVFNALLAHLTLSSTNFCFISYRCNCMYILQMLLYVYLQMLLYVYLTDVTVCISYRLYCMCISYRCFWMYILQM